MACTSPTGAPAATTEVDTLELVRLLLDQDDADVTSFVDSLQQRGFSPDTLYIGMLSDAARHLGEMWLADRCDFVQVTIGLGRLQQAARYLSPRFQTQATAEQPQPVSYCCRRRASSIRLAF